MSPQSPLSFLQGLLHNFPTPAAPAWAVEEAHRKCVLALNHVLMQEPQAMQGLVQQSGRVVRAQWRDFTFAVQITPAGLFDVAAEGATPELTLQLTESSPFAMAQYLVRGDKPPVRIEGDVQLAAQVHWLIDNVRWDLEEDLSRIFGDVPAHVLMDGARMVTGALRDFVGRRSKPAAASNTRNGTRA